MKRFLVCLVVLIAAAALVAPAYAVESTFGGLWRVRAFSQDNAVDGNDNQDDNINRVDQRLRFYYFATASENLRVVMRLETDQNWGDPNTGGQRGADKVTIELKNSYIDFNVPGAPIRAQLGTQGISLHRGWFVADDFTAARFDFNFDPASLMTYFSLTKKDGVASGSADYTDSSDMEFQFVLSGAYKQEMWSGRLSLAYERGENQGPNSTTPAADNIKSDDLYLLMFDVDAGGDMWSAFLTAGFNFGSVDKVIPSVGDPDQDYAGWMVDVGGKYMFDPVTVNASFFYVSGQELDTATGAAKEPKDIDVFSYLNGRSHYWSEILGFGVFDISGLGDGPTNTMAFNLGVSGKATDTTDLSLQYWYVTTPEDVWASGTPGTDATFESDVGSEIDLIITQTIYEGFKATLVGAYLFAGDAYAGWLGNPAAAGKTADDAYETGIQLQYTW